MDIAAEVEQRILVIKLTFRGACSNTLSPLTENNIGYVNIQHMRDIDTKAMLENYKQLKVS